MHKEREGKGHVPFFSSLFPRAHAWLWKIQSGSRDCLHCILSLHYQSVVLKCHVPLDLNLQVMLPCPHNIVCLPNRGFHNLRNIFPGKSTFKRFMKFFSCEINLLICISNSQTANHNWIPVYMYINLWTSPTILGVPCQVKYYYTIWSSFVRFCWILQDMVKWAV